MKNPAMKKFFRSETTNKYALAIAFIVLMYLLISSYFMNHYFFHCVINDVNVSLMAYDEVDEFFRDSIDDYELLLIERNDEIEKITGKEIGLQYNKNNSMDKINHRQNAFAWIGSIFKHQKHVVEDMFIYNQDYLTVIINNLHCLNKEITEAKNVSFTYSNGSYEMHKEIYGDKVYKDKLIEAITNSIVKGSTILDLNKNFCYENPKYTVNSSKATQTLNTLNKNVNTEITYLFGSKKERLDGSIINQWLMVDENLEILIDGAGASEYVRSLSKVYDTAGRTRNFSTSTGKTVKVKGGLYGWKINVANETKALIENVKHGEILEKEPIYAQKAASREENDIGNTYVEINITKQLLWFYKDGRLITRGHIVTGNPSKGYSTDLGTYMLIYKLKDTTLRGHDYESKVSYWMPFYGNIGIHDASWRYSFGGDIYKTRGSHGCINTPSYLARSIYENIEAGDPIVCYTE